MCNVCYIDLSCLMPMNIANMCLWTNVICVWNPASPTGYVQVFEYKIYLLDGGWMEGGRVRPVRIGIDITQSDSVICL